MKQQELNREVIPSEGVGIKYFNGIAVACERETDTLLFIGRESETSMDMEGEEREVVRAFVVTVPNPVTRAAAIDAAERAAYNLRTDGEVASFNAALARKARQGVDIEEVADHDQFIDWAKAELSAIGILK